MLKLHFKPLFIAATIIASSIVSSTNINGYTCSYDSDAHPVVEQQSNLNNQEDYKTLLNQFRKQHKLNNLVQAIINNDIESVKTILSTSNLKNINKQIEAKYYTINSKAPAEEPSVALTQAQFKYLALAIIASKNCLNKVDKQTNFKIIEALLDAKANPNDMFGYAIFVPDENCNWLDYPWSGQIAFAALMVQDKDILELLFKHGASANSKAPTYGNLMTDAKKTAPSLVPLIKKYLAIQNITNKKKQDKIHDNL